MLNNGKTTVFIEVRGYKVGNIRDLICWKLLEKVGGFLFLNLRLLLLLDKPVLLGAAEETLFKR